MNSLIPLTDRFTGSTVYVNREHIIEVLPFHRGAPDPAESVVILTGGRRRYVRETPAQVNQAASV